MKKISARVPIEWGTERMTQWKTIGGKKYVMMRRRPTLYGLNPTKRSAFTIAVIRLAQFEDAAEEAALRAAKKDEGT